MPSNGFSFWDLRLKTLSNSDPLFSRDFIGKKTPISGLIAISNFVLLPKSGQITFLGFIPVLFLNMIGDKLRFSKIGNDSNWLAILKSVSDFSLNGISDWLWVFKLLENPSSVIAVDLVSKFLILSAGFFDEFPFARLEFSALFSKALWCTGLNVIWASEADSLFTNDKSLLDFLAHPSAMFEGIETASFYLWS